jgi:signal transduction histidine kinase
MVDVTEKAALEKEKESLLSEAKEAIRGRDEFISIAAHELRTPLTPLQLQITTIRSLLSQKQLSSLSESKLQRLFEIAETQILRLARLIDNLMDVSRISLGHLKLSPELICLRDLVFDILERYQSETGLFPEQIETDIDFEICGYWDRLRIEQVIVNLLSNAAKYGAGNKIVISARKQKGEVEFSVRDHGIGIAQDAFDRIFQRFERAVNGQSIHGLGLGLFITQQIVLAHRGKINVKSELGKGSQFTVRLPQQLFA